MGNAGIDPTDAPRPSPATARRWRTPQRCWRHSAFRTGHNHEHGTRARSPQRSADSPRLLREINDHVVLGLLLAEGPMTRGRIGEHTGLSKPTVSSLLTRLDERGLVTTTGVVEGGPGPERADLRGQSAGRIRHRGACRTAPERRRPGNADRRGDRHPCGRGSATAGVGAGRRDDGRRRRCARRGRRCPAILRAQGGRGHARASSIRSPGICGTPGTSRAGRPRA